MGITVWGSMLVIIGVVFIVTFGIAGSSYVFPILGIISTVSGLYLAINGSNKMRQFKNEKEIFLISLES